MRIVVCAKEVLDPDAVNNYALAGKLTIGDDGRTITQAAIPPLLNAYDEQAIEAALRIRDSGAECAVTTVSVGAGPASILKHAAALGSDEIVAITLDPSTLDCAGVATILAAYIRTSGGADLVLCGRQASDDDQGVVPALIGEILGMPVITIAREIVITQADRKTAVRVTRVTPDGDEVVEATCPAVVTVSSELGQPRYPTAARSMQARRMQPAAVSLQNLSLSAPDIAPRTVLARQFVPSVQGSCEFISGGSAGETAASLIDRLRADRIIP